MNCIFTDILIIGAGLSGVCAAITAQECSSNVLVIDKGRMFFSGSTFANFNKRWGITYGANDKEKELLFNMICNLAKGTNDKRLSKIVVEDSGNAFYCLKSWGTEFAMTDERLIKRVAPCYVNHPLASVISSVESFSNNLDKLIRRSSIKVLNNKKAYRLLVSQGLCIGCIAKDVVSGEEVKIRSRATILTTGGDCSRYHTNIVDTGLTGDGYAMLNEYGIPLENMQYHQWVWEDVSLSSRRFSYTELLNPELEFYDYNGSMIDMRGLQEKYTSSRKLHVPIANLQADRDFDELLLKRIPKNIPQYAIRVKEKHGKELFRILPHCQVCNGGVKVGLNGETSLPGLYAAGEVTTGMHGGDRVGGMMITSAMVFGKRAALHACKEFVH